MPNFSFPSLDAAIAQFEGFNTPGTIAQRQNNPGALIYNDYTKSLGASGAGTRGLAIFPDAATGAAAEDALVKNYVDKGSSLSEMLTAWSPPGAAGNSQLSTTNYINTVAQQTGLNPNLPISDQNPGGTSSGLQTPGLPLLDVGTGGITGAIKGTINGLIESGGNPIMGLTGALGGSVGVNSTNPSYLFAGFSWGRVLSVVIGVIMVGAGLYMFKPVQDVVVNVGGKVKRGAELAAA